MARNMLKTEEDFIKAQQEAIIRVREMQARARHTLESAGVRLEPSSGYQFPIEPEPQPPAQPIPMQNQQPQQGRQNPPEQRNAQPPQNHNNSNQSTARQPERRSEPQHQQPSNQNTQHTQQPNTQQSRQPNRDMPPRPPVPAQNRSVHEPPENKNRQGGGLNISSITDFLSGGLPKLPLEVFNLSLDHEQIIILILLYVLYIDKADPYLMIALAYILL